MQEFKLDKRFLRLWKASFYFFIFLILSGVGFFSINGINGFNGRDLMFFGAFFALIVYLAIQSGYDLSKIDKSDVVLDEDGIWYKHMTKAGGLVMWGRIVRLNEKLDSQCLDLLDHNGKVLLRAEYQLRNFEELRKILFDRLGRNEVKSLPTIFAKGFFYHLFYISFVAGVSVAAYLAAQYQAPVLILAGAVFVIAVILYEYLIQIYKFEIEPGCLNLYYPAEKKTIELCNISEIKLSDSFYRGTRIPEIQIKVANNPDLIKHRDVDGTISELFVVLKKNMEERGFSDRISYVSENENEEEPGNFYQ